MTNRGYVSGDKSETLRAESHMAIPCIVYPAAFMGGQGAKARSMARDYKDPQIVCYDARGNGDGRTIPTITGDHENRVTDYTAIVANSSGGGKAATLDASYYKGPGARNGNEREFLVQKSKPPRKYIVRRLTPLECCRLQGFPDWWEDGVKGSDSERYKMWGNGIALPCAADVLGRVAKAARETED